MARKRIVELAEDEAMATADIASLFGVSESGVRRVLQHFRERDTHLPLLRNAGRRPLMTAEVSTPVRDFVAAHAAVWAGPKFANVVTGDNFMLVRVFNTKGGAQLKQLAAHRSVVLLMAATNDGALVASGGVDGSAFLWDLKADGPLHTLDGLGTIVSGLAFAPDGSKLYAAGSDREIHVFDPATGQQTESFADPKKLGITHMALSGDGKYLLTSTYDKKVRSLDATDGHEVTKSAAVADHLSAIAVSPDGRMAASTIGGKEENRTWTPPADRSAQLWDFSAAVDGK